MSIRRRRQCLRCNYRFTTYERIEAAKMSVVKKDGRRELFSRDKVSSGIYRACEKRPVAVALIEEIVDQIERDIRARGEAEVPTTAVGELVMEKLAAVDDVAYVRFASVYRSFTDLASFEAELTKLRNRAA